MRLPASQKLQILQKALREGVSISSVCRQNKISRKTFYVWKKKYSAAGPRSKPSCLEKRPLRGLQHPRGKRGLFKNEVLKILVAHPEWGSHKISQILSRGGKRLGNHGTYTLLKEIGLEKAEKRWEFSGLHRTLRQVRDKFAPGPRRLLSEARKRMAEEVLLTGKGVGEVAEEFKVSRKTVWKWICRYQEAQKKQATLLLALSDQHPRAWAHPRGTPEWLEKKILGVVSEHPEYSVHTLAKFLAGQIGSHGVQNVLLRNDLNTYQKRALYAQSQVPATAIVRPATGWLNRLKTVFATFLPQLAPAPPPRLRELLKVFSTSFAFSSILGLLFLLWLQMLSGQSFSSKLGLIFASLSLTFGLFFFLYSFKYYFTLILILGFSRQVSGGEQIANSKWQMANRENGNGGGSIWGRVFGAKTNGNGYGNGNGNGQKILAGGLQPNLDHIKLERQPFVSIHLPLYNEKRVVDRLLTAATSMNYENYEVVVVDDSIDETTEILKGFLKRGRRESREIRGDQGEKIVFTPTTLHSPQTPASPVVTLIHRSSREGFKGGALKVALEKTDPQAEFILVFDADFLPYPDTITQFLKYFQVTAGGLDFGLAPEHPRGVPQAQHHPAGGKSESPIAAVQGYQWHVLNKSENWITRGVRSEYAGSYVVERSGAEILGGLKQIAGSVYMIRADVLKNYGWGTSITEDFELTLKLYRDGYKVVYTPYIQAPSECVSTLKRLIRQRMRWAEGHTHNIRKMFRELMWGSWQTEDGRRRTDGGFQRTEDRGQRKNQSSVIDLQNQSSAFSLQSSRTWTPSKLTLMEKLEFLYLSPYYLQAAFFMLGTFSWFISEAIFQTKLPFWTSLWGWSLVFTNLLSLPLMNTVGLFLEESEERDYGGIISFIFLSYLLVPFQGYAALKGFLEKEEGPWFRTPKTGKITDIFTPGRFARFISGIFGRPASAPAIAGATAGKPAFAFLHPKPYTSSSLSGLRAEGLNLNPYLSLATANNRFDNFRVSRKRLRGLSASLLAVLLIISSTLAYFAPRISRFAQEETVGGSFITGRGGKFLKQVANFGASPVYAVAQTPLNFVGWENGNNTEALVPTGTFLVQSTVVRTGGYALRVYPTTTALGYHRLRTLAATGAPAIFNDATLYITFYFRYATRPVSGDEEIISTDNTGNYKFSLRLDSDGNINAYNSAQTLLSSGTTALSANTWYRLDVTIGTGTSGSYALSINGTSEYSGTGNLLTGNNNEVWVGKRTNRNGQTIDVFYDDMVIDDAAYATTPEIVLMNPDGNGTYTAWTGVYTDVDDVPHDTETTFITTSTSTAAETVTLESASAAGVVGAIVMTKSIAIVRDEGGTSAIQVRLRSGSTDDDTTNNDLSTTYVLRGKLYATDPADSAAWTSGDLDALEVGVENNASVAVRSTALGVMVLTDGQEAPNTPTLDSPTDAATNVSTTPALKTTATDNDSDNLRYKIQLDTVTTFDSGNLQTFDQTVSQTGWSGQNADSNTAYTSGTQATYTVQSALTENTTYYWRSYAIDYAGSNTWSSTQGTPYSFTTVPEWSIVFILLAAFLPQRLRRKLKGK